MTKSARWGGMPKSLRKSVWTSSFASYTALGSAVATKTLTASFANIYQRTQTCRYIAKKSLMRKLLGSTCACANALTLNAPLGSLIKLCTMHCANSSNLHRQFSSRTARCMAMVLNSAGAGAVLSGHFVYKAKAYL